MTHDQVQNRLSLFQTNPAPLTEDEQKVQLNTLQTKVRLNNWGDHSSLSAHGYLLYTITIMYDPAVFAHPEVSSSEMQRQVEQPNIYLLAMSSDSVADKLMYVDDRINDIKRLALSISLPGHDQPFSFVLRSFKGDNPEQQYEAGINQGGHYKCSACGAKTSTYIDMPQCLKIDRLSIAERNDIATGGVLGKEASHAKPFHALKKKSLVRELASRNMNTEGEVKDLHKRLQKRLRGTQRVLTLMYRTPTASLEENNLGSYEIFAAEGLHDVKDHIRNVLEELPHHLADQAQKAIETLKKREFGSRAMIRGSDYRRAAMKLPAAIRGKVDRDGQQLIDTMAEVAILFYAKDEVRTPIFILRLYNVLFLHAQLCLKVLFPPKSLSVGALYGLYFHKLMKHAAEDTRIVSGYTRLAENEEWQFKQRREFAPCTSGHPEDVAKQLFERLQVRQATASSSTSFTMENNQLEQKAAKLQSLREDTVFTDAFITTNSSAVQVHLERIADFLQPGPGVWWVREGTSVRFLDGRKQPNSRPESPKLAHFRNTSVKEELQKVKAAWQECLRGHIELPLVELRLQNAGERPHYVSWPPTGDGETSATNEQEDEPMDIDTEHREQHQEDTSVNTEHRQEEEDDTTDDESEEKHDATHNNQERTADSTPGLRHQENDENKTQRKVSRRRLPFIDQRTPSHLNPGDHEDCRVTPVLDEVNTDEQERHEAPTSYHTLHGKWLARCLGESADITEYDNLRHAIKMKKESSASACAQYKAVARQLHKQLLSALQDVETTLVKGKATTCLKQKRQILDKLLATWNC